MKKFKKIMSLSLCFVLLFGGSMVFAEDNAGTVPTAPTEATPVIAYRTHVQNIGWQDWAKEGTLSGTTGRSLRLEAIELNLDKSLIDYKDVRLQYETHIQNIGWQGLVEEGQVSGTSGQSLRLEAIRIKLVGADADRYNIYYRVHAQNFGWLGWAENGGSSGTAGFGDRLEGIEIMLSLKNNDVFEGKLDHYNSFVEYVAPVVDPFAFGNYDPDYANSDHSFNATPGDTTGSNGGDIFSGN